MTSGTNFLIPVKNPDSAKQRLADVLTASERRELALALMDTVLDAALCARTREDCGILIITDSEEIDQRAAARGVTVLREQKAEGETAAIESATRWSLDHGFGRQIVIPGDMPWIDAQDVRALIDFRSGPRSVVLCPATGDDGTNAIVTCPPDVLTYRFGQNSFPDYVDQCRRRGIECHILRLPRLALDLDTPEDLKIFMDRPADNPVYRLVSVWNLQKRRSAVRG